jgi:hypothetical protein
LTQAKALNPPLPNQSDSTDLSGLAFEAFSKLVHLASGRRPSAGISGWWSRSQPGCRNCGASRDDAGRLRALCSLLHSDFLTVTKSAMERCPRARRMSDPPAADSATAILGRKSRGFERRHEVSNVAPRKPTIDPTRALGNDSGDPRTGHSASSQIARDVTGADHRCTGRPFAEARTTRTRSTRAQRWY